MYLEFAVGWIICVLLGGFIGGFRGRRSFGAFLGFLLGPLGWVIILCMSDCRKKCQYCGGSVPDCVRKCMHCGSDLYEARSVTPLASPLADRLNSPGKKIIIRKR
jgi:hypothetical protein